MGTFPNCMLFYSSKIYILQLPQDYTNKMERKIETIKKTIREYGLGELDSLREFDVGISNHNYLATTTSGKYVIRIQGEVVNPEITPRTGLEFQVLDFLPSTNLTYETPRPIKNSREKVLQKIGKDSFYIYPFIEGEVIKKSSLTNDMIEEIGKALGEYHVAVADFPDASKKVLPIHGDFSYDNMIWTRNKVKGIIDFDGVVMKPREVDLVRSIYDNCATLEGYSEESIRNFLGAYQQVTPLETEEKANLFSGLLLRASESFRFAAIGNSKMNIEKRIKNLNKANKRAKYLIENEGKINKALME